MQQVHRDRDKSFGLSEDNKTQIVVGLSNCKMVCSEVNFHSGYRK